MRPRTCGRARPAEPSGLSSHYGKQQAGPCWTVRAGPGGHLLSLLCSRDSPRHGAGARGTAAQGFCGPWAPGAPQHCPAHCRLPCPGALTGPPAASLRPLSPQSRSTSACTLDTLAAWASPAHHARTWQPCLQPFTETASGPQCLARPCRPPGRGWRGAETSQAEGPPSSLGDHTVSREKNAQKPCEMAVDT